MQIKGKTFIVTGGASGLGRATVELLVSLGGNAVIFDLNEKEGRELENSNKKQILYVHVNVCSESDVKKGISELVNKFGNTLVGVINAAGIGDPKKVYNNKTGEASPLESFNKVLTVNVSGTFNVIRLAVEQIMKQQVDNPKGEEVPERGVIINTASIAAFEGQIGQAAYSASKGAVVSMTLPIARELSLLGIRCVTIAPGLFKTPMLAGLGEKVIKSLAKQVPFPRRLGEPEEYAKCCQYIIENEMMNGETIRLDGAIRMSSL
ncbi:hypothetical protein ABK040_015830 [Willaertia magna]